MSRRTGNELRATSYELRATYELSVRKLMSKEQTKRAQKEHLTNSYRVDNY